MWLRLNAFLFLFHKNPSMAFFKKSFRGFFGGTFPPLGNFLATSLHCHTCSKVFPMPQISAEGVVVFHFASSLQVSLFQKQ